MRVTKSTVILIAGITALLLEGLLMGKMLIHIFRITFPVYHILPPFYINRTRLSIQSQSQSLKVNKFGVELISRTSASEPEQCTVPPGIR